jgi:hypothetical protein
VHIFTTFAVLTIKSGIVASLEGFGRAIVVILEPEYSTHIDGKWSPCDSQYDLTHSKNVEARNESSRMILTSSSRSARVRAPTIKK